MWHCHYSVTEERHFFCIGTLDYKNDHAMYRYMYSILGFRGLPSTAKTTVLHCACAGGCLPVVEFLLKNSDADRGARKILQTVRFSEKCEKSFFIHVNSL